MNIEDKEFFGVISDSQSRLDLWEKLINSSKIKTMVEIGVWKGEFAEYILRHCESITNYSMIDPWANLPDWNKPFNVQAEVFDEIMAEAMLRTGFASTKINVLRGRTKEVIDEIPDESIDFAYIDGDHTLRGITIDLIRLLPKIKFGGFIGGDDFLNTPWQHDFKFEPTLVCPFSIYFAEAMNLPIMALPFNQFLIQKQFNGKFVFLDKTGDYSDLSLNKVIPNPGG